MASFLKNIFGGNKNTVNESNNTEDSKMIAIQKWNKSVKSLDSLNYLFEIQDENFIIKELVNSKTVFKVQDEKEYSRLIGLINQKENGFKNNKITEIISNIKEFDKIKAEIESKQVEVNKIVPEINKTFITTANKQNKNDKIIPLAPLYKFNFEFNKFFFGINDNLMKLAFADKNQKTRIYFGYVEFLINNVLNEEYIKDNFNDFYVNAKQQNLNFNGFIYNMRCFVYSKVFDILITKENYLNIIYSLLIDLENCKEEDFNISSIKSCVLLLIPNVFNYRDLISKNFFRLENHLNFLFTNKPLSTLIKDKELHLDIDLVNSFLNFLIEFENYVEINEKKSENDLIANNPIIKPSFFKVYESILEMIFENQILKNLNSIVFDFEFNQMVFLDYLISLYRTLKMFNRNYNSRETINLENDTDLKGTETIIEKENSEKKPLITYRKESLDYKNKFNLEKFLLSELDNSINDEVLAKEIFTVQPEEITRDTNILINFIDQIFNIVFLKSHTIEKFVNQNKTQNEVLEAINDNFIYNEKIKKLPAIILLKIIQMNSPIIVLQNFIKKSIDVDIDKNKKNGFLKFVCFTILKNSFEILSDKAQNYPSLLARLELVNNFLDTAKLISDIRTKIEFLGVINNKSSSSSKKNLNENHLLTLKNIIFEEEKLKSFINTKIKKNSASTNNIKNLFFNDLSDLKEFRFLMSIYDFILLNTNKFNSSKGIKLFKHFEKEIESICKYLDLVNQIAFSNESLSKKNLSFVDFILFFIKNEKLEIHCLEFLKENREIYNQISLDEFQRFLDLYANGKDSLKDKDTAKGIESLELIAKCLSYFENSDSRDANNESKDNLNLEDINKFFLKELNYFAKTKNEKEFYNKVKELKFKISQLLKLLRLKKIFIENALNIDLKDFDYENLNVNSVIEVFIVKKFNIDLINDINDFYSKTTDIREALGLSWDEYLIELSALFFKYKMHNMYANILNVFLEKNYATFEKCLFNLKKDKNFDLIKFIFERKFELKILENSQNITLINQINEHLNFKNKMSANSFEDLMLSENAENKINKGFNNPNKGRLANGDFDKSEFFSLLDYRKTKDQDAFIGSSAIKENFNFKKEFSPEREYLEKFKEDNSFKDNFIHLLDTLNCNFDLEKFNNSRHLKGEVENTNNSYSLHPKLIELLDNINYNFRGKEFKLNTNIAMKAKLYRKILSKNFCAVENILQWENFSFDLKSLKNLPFLESRNLNFNKNKNDITDEKYLIKSTEDEKIFYLINLLSLIYTGKDSKFDLIFDNLTKIFIEKFEIIFSKFNKEHESREELTLIETRIELFIMDSVYFILKNTKTFNFSSLLFWRTFIKKLIDKINSTNPTNEFLIEISKLLQNIQTQFLHFGVFKESGQNNPKIPYELLEVYSKKSDFIMESIQKITHQFNILLLFGEEFLQKYDFNFKIRNLILKPELDEFSKRYNYFKNLKNKMKKVSNNTPNKDSLDVSYNDFHLNFLCNVFKNLTLNNIFNFIKIINSNVLSKIFDFNENSFFMSNEFLNLKHLLGIKLINNLSNISGFMNVDQSLSFLVFNYLKNYVNTESEFRELINELLFVPKFNILLDASSNIILLEKNLNHIVKDYFETKISIFNQIANLFKDKYKISPIAETTLKLVKIKKFICDSFNSNLRNVFSDISEMDNFQELENYIKDDRFKKEIYKIYSSN